MFAEAETAGAQGPRQLQHSDLAGRIRFADSTLRPPRPRHHLPDGHCWAWGQHAPDSRPARRTNVDRLLEFQRATPQTTVYAICSGRGFNGAASVLGTDYAGVLVRDGWAAYRRFGGLHQTCLNHLFQRCKQLRLAYPDSRWAGDVQATLRAGLDLRDRCHAGEVSEHGMATARGRLTARLGRLVDAPPPLDDAERFAKHLATEFPAVFLFLSDPSLDATNWRAEQAIRPAVVIRKVCGGNRTRQGADTQQVLASVVRTARQRNLDLPALIAAMLHAPEPVVPELLGLPPPPARAGQNRRTRGRETGRIGSRRSRSGERPGRPRVVPRGAAARRPDAGELRTRR